MNAPFEWGPTPRRDDVVASFEQYPDDECCYFVLEGGRMGEWVRSDYVVEIEQ